MKCMYTLSSQINVIWQVLMFHLNKCLVYTDGKKLFYKCFIFCYTCMGNQQCKLAGGLGIKTPQSFFLYQTTPINQNEVRKSV